MVNPEMGKRGKLDLGNQEGSRAICVHWPIKQTLPCQSEGESDSMHLKF